MIGGADSDAVDPRTPHARRALRMHLDLAGPAVPVADDVHDPGGGRPHREAATAVAGLRSELFVEATVSALTEQM